MGVAYFEKVSFEQFKSDCWDHFSSLSNDKEEVEKVIREVYDGIELPKRGTAGSAGYDFYAPYRIVLSYDTPVVVPTGIRCVMKNNVVLQMYPRSGMGFKHRVRLENTVGIIDSDYSKADNEGHIMIKITKCKKDANVLNVAKGTAFCQGIFTEYLLVDGDEYDNSELGDRTGGFGSTG